MRLTVKTASRTTIAIAPCSFELPAVQFADIQLAPADVFKARDGRPHGLAGWTLDEVSGPRVAAQAALRKTPLVIDYEHQTLNSADNGKPAPAAGWIKSLTWHPGEGLFGLVEWTAQAEAMIAAKEYRFISPVPAFDRKTGEVLRLEMAALTNNPALDGLREIELRAAAKFDPALEDPQVNPILAALLTLLKLPEDATEAQATAELKALLEDVTSKETKIVALTATQFDAVKYVPIAVVDEMRNQIAALTASDRGREVDTLVKSALEDGRLLPAMEPWARDLGKSDFVALKAYVEAAQPIAALVGTQTRGKVPAGADGQGLSESDLAVYTQLGIDPEAYNKTNAHAA